MKYIKTIIPLILVISILVCTSVSASAISTTLPQVTNTDQIMSVWGTSNYSWSQNSTTYNMTLTAPYGDTSVLHGIMQGQALQNNTVIAFRNDIMDWLNNSTYGGKAISNLLNDCKNYLNSSQSYLSTIKTDISSIKSSLGGSSINTVYSELSAIDSNLGLIQNILGSSASSGNIASIADDLSTIKVNPTPSYPLKAGWGSSLSTVLSTYPTGYSASYYLNVLRELDAIRSNTSASGSSGIVDYSSILNNIYSDTSYSRNTLDNIAQYSANTLQWVENSNTYISKVGTADSALAMYQFLTNWQPTYASPVPTNNEFTLGTGFGDNGTSDFWHSVDDSLSNITSTTVPDELKTGWGISSNSYPSGYSSSYYETMRSFIRNINSVLYGISLNSHDYSTDISDINNQSGYILDELESLSVNDWSSGTPESMTNSWYSSVNNRLDELSDMLITSSSSIVNVDKSSMYVPTGTTSFTSINTNIPAFSDITIYRRSTSPYMSAKYIFDYADGTQSSYITAPYNTSQPSSVVFNTPKSVTRIRIYALSYRANNNVYYHISYPELTPVNTSVAELVADIREIIASPIDSSIREESTNVITNYNNTFVSGERGVSGNYLPCGQWVCDKSSGN